MCASGVFFGGLRREAAAPGAASAGRAGVSRLVLLGDPPSLDGDDADPHCCAWPFDAVAVPSRAATAACLATWARGLLFGANGVAAGGRLANPTTRAGMPPSAATASVATTVPASIKDSEIVPSCPASRQMVSRSRRAAAFGMLPRRPSGRHAPRRSAPVRSHRAAWRIRAKCRCISPATPQCASIPETAPGRRWPCPAAAPSCRIPACRPVSRSAGVASGPRCPRAARCTRAAQGWRHNSIGTKAAPEESS